MSMWATSMLCAEQSASMTSRINSTFREGLFRKFGREDRMQVRPPKDYEVALERIQITN